MYLDLCKVVSRYSVSGLDSALRNSPQNARAVDSPKPVSFCLQDYYDYLQSFGHPGPDLMRHVHDLPSTLGTDMATELYRPTISKIPLFYGVKTAFLESIVRGLNLCVYLKGTCEASTPLVGSSFAQPAQECCMLQGKFTAPNMSEKNRISWMQESLFTVKETSHQH